MVNNKQPRGRSLSHSRANCAWWLGTRTWFISDLAALSLIYGSRSATPVYFRPRQLPISRGMPRPPAMSHTTETCKLRMADYVCAKHVQAGCTMISSIQHPLRI